MILEKVDEGSWIHVSSGIADIEIAANPDPKRRERVRLLLPDAANIVMLTPAIIARGAALEKLGFKPADALHVAAAEEARADVLLSCDDRFCRTGLRQSKNLRVVIRNPLDWLKEVEDANDA
jgi:predicted nucleic acid-binding protein